MGEIEEVKEVEKKEPKDLQVIIDNSMEAHKELLLVLGTLFLKIDGVEKKMEKLDGVFKSFSQ